MEIKVYKAVSGKLRISETYGLSDEAYKRLKKAGLPVYESMGGSYNLRDDRAYTLEQIMKITKIVKDFS